MPKPPSEEILHIYLSAYADDEDNAEWHHPTWVGHQPAKV